MTPELPNTMTEIAQQIAAHWQREYGVTVNPADILGFSSTGDPSMIYIWYEDALIAERTHPLTPRKTPVTRRTS